MYVCLCMYVCMYVCLFSLWGHYNSLPCPCFVRGGGGGGGGVTLHLGRSPAVGINAMRLPNASSYDNETIPNSIISTFIL